MPTNLPPEYFDAEKRYRAAKTPAEKLVCLEEMLTIPETTLRDPEGGRYGLGVVEYYSEILGTRVIGHGGSSLGYSAAALYLPEYGLSVAWSINTGESPRGLADNLMQNTWSNLSQVLSEHGKLDP